LLFLAPEDIGRVPFIIDIDPFIIDIEKLEEEILLEFRY